MGDGSRGYVEADGRFKRTADSPVNSEGLTPVMTLNCDCQRNAEAHRTRRFDLA